MASVTYRGIPIHYHEQGKGPAVVFLHGFLETKSMWNRMAEALSGSYKVITIDLLGHGETPCLGYVHTMDEMADAVRCVLDHLRIKKHTVIGHSMGGYVALALAERFPDSLRGLGLFHSTPRSDTPEKSEGRRKAMEVAKKSKKTYVRLAIPALFRPKSRELFRTEIADLKKAALNIPLQGIIAAQEGMILRPDREALMHFGPYPVLVIGGKRDPVIPLEVTLDQINAKNTTHSLLTENGHMGYIEDFDACLSVIRSFLSDRQKP